MAHIRIDSETLFTFTDPDPALIHVEDIAKVLSRTPRFNGHGVKGRKIFVSEHSVNVYNMVKKRTELEMCPSQHRKDIRIAALLHDGHEYVVGDIATPVKIVFGREMISAVTDLIDGAIGEAVGFDHTMMKCRYVKEADKSILPHESHWIFQGYDEDAATTFLQDLAKARTYTHKVGLFDRKPKIGLSEDEAYDVFMTAFHEVMGE